MNEPAKHDRLKVLDDAGTRRAFAMHERLWQSNRYVYAVVSRRSRGISIGMNLNPDKVCNFDCIYCSVNRKEPLAAWQTRDVDLAILRSELAAILALVKSGEIYRIDPFDGIPERLRRVNDIAFSGDGEPTTSRQLAEAVRLAAQAVQEHGADVKTGGEAIKLVLITNATMFHKPAVRQVLEFLDGHHGEIWAKLDAGTQAYYHLVDRTGVPFQRVLENVTWCCQTRPTVIQTLLMKVHGVAPPAEEILAYARRLREITLAGGIIKLVQLYTVVRGTAESFVGPLRAEELEAIARVVRAEVPGVSVDVYP